jgi:rhodanese-related sulfurtransferase
MASPKSPTAARVRRDMEDGHALGVNATPTFFIGQKGFEGAIPMVEFDRLINQELASRGMTAPQVPPQLSPPPVASAPHKKTTTVAANPDPANPNPSNPKSDTPASGKIESEPRAESGGLFGKSPGSIFQQFQASGQTCSEAEAAKKQPTQITSDQLRPILSGKLKPLFVDVREPKEYATGKIPGAINVPVDDMGKRWNTLPKDRVIVLYESGRSAGDVCAAGRAAGRILLEHGYPFNQVKVYQDGLAGWEKSGLSINE